MLNSKLLHSGTFYGTVRDILNKLRHDNFLVDHQVVKGLQLLPDDWFRVYKDTPSNFLCIVDIEDLGKISPTVLDTKIRFISIYLIGGYTAVDCILL